MEQLVNAEHASGGKHGVTAAFGRRLVVLWTSGMDVPETETVTISRLSIAHLAMHLDK